MSTMEESVQALETFSVYHLETCDGHAQVAVVRNGVAVRCSVCAATVTFRFTNASEHELAAVARGLQRLGRDRTTH